jgi:hypothetical protein
MIEDFEQLEEVILLPMESLSVIMRDGSLPLLNEYDRVRQLLISRMPCLTSLLSFLNLHLNHNSQQPPICMMPMPSFRSTIAPTIQLQTCFCIFTLLCYFIIVTYIDIHPCLHAVPCTTARTSNAYRLPIQTFCHSQQSIVQSGMPFPKGFVKNFGLRGTSTLQVSFVCLQVIEEQPGCQKSRLV